MFSPPARDGAPGRRQVLRPGAVYWLGWLASSSSAAPFPGWLAAIGQESSPGATADPGWQPQRELPWPLLDEPELAWLISRPSISTAKWYVSGSGTMSPSKLAAVVSSWLSPGRRYSGLSMLKKLCEAYTGSPGGLQAWRPGRRRRLGGTGLHRS